MDPNDVTREEGRVVIRFPLTRLAGQGFATSLVSMALLTFTFFSDLRGVPLRVAWVLILAVAFSAPVLMLWQLLAKFSSLTIDFDAGRAVLTGFPNRRRELTLDRIDSLDIQRGSILGTEFGELWLRIDGRPRFAVHSYGGQVDLTQFARWLKRRLGHSVLPSDLLMSYEFVPAGRGRMALQRRSRSRRIFGDAAGLFLPEPHRIEIDEARATLVERNGSAQSFPLVHRDQLEVFQLKQSSSGYRLAQLEIRDEHGKRRAVIRGTGLESLVGLQTAIAEVASISKSDAA